MMSFGFDIQAMQNIDS